MGTSILALLRDQIGFDGLVVNDDLGAMAAITDRVDLPRAVRQSLAAGVDMALWITTDRLAEVLDHLEQAVAGGSLPHLEPPHLEPGVRRPSYTLLTVGSYSIDLPSVLPQGQNFVGTVELAQSGTS